MESLEARVKALETEVAELKKLLSGTKQAPWWELVAGKFANDPIYDEAMRLGREYRESQRPKPRKKIKKPASKSTKRSRV